MAAGRVKRAGAKESMLRALQGLLEALILCSIPDVL